MATKKKESVEIYVASCAFYLESRGAMQSHLYADASYSKLVKKFLKDVGSWCDTKFTFKELEVKPSAKGVTYKISVNHLSWEEPYVMVMEPRGDRQLLQGLLLHIVHNTFDGVSGYIVTRWREQRWVYDVMRQMEVIESTYKLEGYAPVA
jgi:hypothetical protein